MVNEEKIRCFLLLAKTLNFTRAADSLFMTQQGFSRQIASLEQDVGFQLFDRSTKQVSLTEEGKAFYQAFDDIRAKYYECINHCLSLQEPDKKELRIGFQNMLQYGHAPMLADKMMRQNVEGYVMNGILDSPYDLIEKFKQGSLDLIMIYKRFFHDINKYENMLIKKYPVVLMAADSDEKIPNVLFLDEKEQYLVRLYPASEALQKAGLFLPEIHTRVSRDSVFLAVELGQGYCLGTPQSQIEGHKLRFIPTDLENELVCIWRKGSAENLSRQFALCMRQAFSDQ